MSAYVIFAVLHTIARLTSVSGLLCSTGLIIDAQNVSNGATVECSNDNPQCVEFRGGVDEVYHFYFCTSFRVAANELYGSPDRCVNSSGIATLPCQAFCSSDNCNTAQTGRMPFPPSEFTGNSINCYNGIADSASGFYLRGGVDACNTGVCVTHMYNGNETRVFGCAPPTLFDQEDCLLYGDLTVCTCNTELCNHLFTPFPSLSGTRSCYSDFSYQGQFYGSIEACEPDEVCVGVYYYDSPRTDLYQCMRQESCIAYWGQHADVTQPCQWADGLLSNRCCCAGDMCNYNAELMASDGFLPTPDPSTNNNDLVCLDAIQFTQTNDGYTGPIIGGIRPCSGVCAFIEFERHYNQWRCLDVDICAKLGITIGQCEQYVIGLDYFCCDYDQRPSTLPVPTPGNGSCPQMWTASKTVPGKCYRVTPENHTWVEAETQCAAMDARSTIVTIRNGFENSEVANLVHDSTAFWVGLYWTTGFWAWADRENVTYTNWAPGEPALTSAHCASVSQAYGSWTAAECFFKSILTVCQLYV